MWLSLATGPGPPPSLRCTVRRPTDRLRRNRTKNAGRPRAADWWSAPVGGPSAVAFTVAIDRLLLRGHGDCDYCGYRYWVTVMLTGIGAYTYGLSVVIARPAV